MRSEGFSFLFLVWGRNRVPDAGARGTVFRTRALAICPMRCALRIGVDRGRLLCRCAVGIGGQRVPLGVSGGAVPWGLVGGVSFLVVLGFPAQCQLVSCPVMSRRVPLCRVVSRRLMSLTRVIDMRPHNSHSIVIDSDPVMSCHVSSCPVGSWPGVPREPLTRVVDESL